METAMEQMHEDARREEGSTTRRLRAMAVAVGLGALITSIAVVRIDRAGEAHASASEPAGSSMEPRSDAGSGVGARESRAQEGFLPTPSQKASLEFSRIDTLEFRHHVQVEGNITVNELRSTQVLSPYSGRVTKIDAAPGDRVQAGDPLFHIWAAEVVQGQGDLRNAVAARSTATAQLKLATATADRQRAMVQARVGAQRDLLQAESDLVSARSALSTANANLSAVRNRLRVQGHSDAEIRSLEHDQPAGGEVVVRAPIAGIVAQRQIGLGQNIASIGGGGSNALFTVADLSNVWLVAQVRESDAGAVRVGDNARVRVPALPNREFSARIDWVAPMLDPGSHRLPVRAVIDNPDGALKPSMLARFVIEDRDGEVRPAVPARAVVHEGDQAHVWVLRPDGRIQVRALRVGRASGDRLEVLDGLQAGETVVSAGALFIDRAAGAGDA